jgi:hypothetical protein
VLLLLRLLQQQTEPHKTSISSIRFRKPTAFPCQTLAQSGEILLMTLNNLGILALGLGN